MTALYPVVLAGGAGTRFWPASRQARPKPFISLVGEDTLLDATLARLAGVPGATGHAVVTSQDLAAVTRRALRGHSGVKLRLEPEARNTAAAIAWAAACALGEGCDGVLGVFPADHHIPQPAAFARTVRSAARAAAPGDKLVLIGIEPRRPDTAYGYLRLGRAAERGAVPVKRFQEKPTQAVARRYVASGEYVWNAGMLVARPELILAETRRHAPEIWGPLGAVLERLAAGRKVPRAELAAAYGRVKPISFDYAVLERSKAAYGIRARFRWSDLGSWDALEEHLPRIAGNRVRADPPPVALEARGNIVWNATGKQVVLLGTDDLVVVETADALLICAKDRAQDVRRVVEELSRRGRKDLA